MSNNMNENAVNVDRLQGHMGIGTLVMSVLAFSGPLLTTSGFIPIYYPYLGSGVPMMFILVTLILVFFATGFAKMGTVMERPGGFYAYVTVGLGRNMGLTAAFLAVAGYISIALFAPPLIAIYAQNVIENILHGPHISWYIIAMISVLFSTFFAYRKIDLSAAVLFYVMIFESLAVFIFDAVCFIHGYSANGGLVMFNAPSIAASGFGVVLLFVIGNFYGFEATVIYREECKDPKRTIPRATFAAVIGIGLFYFLASWAFLAFYGADKIGNVMTQNAATTFMDILGLLSKGFADFISVVVITSCFASMLSIHNVAARYLYSLGKDQVLPSFLGKVHHNHHSPYAAATTVGVVWAITLTIFLFTGKDPTYLYCIFAGTGEFLITMIVFMASLAVIGYFRKNKQFNFSAWETIIAPTLATIGLGFILVMAVLNFDALTGAPGLVSVIFFGAIMLLTVGSYVYAMYLQKVKPVIHGRIGRQDFVDG